VEVPVPGFIAPSYADNYALTDALVREGLWLGVQRFAVDIEAPSVARDTPSHANGRRWSSLGCTRGLTSCTGDPWAHLRFDPVTSLPQLYDERLDGRL
jgi:hypothetical protein